MSSRRSHSGAAQVSFAADGMLAAVFRVALKAFGERARFLTLPGPGFRQVQLDADFLRQVSGEGGWTPGVTGPQLSTVGDETSLLAVQAKFLSCAVSRSIESTTQLATSPDRGSET